MWRRLGARLLLVIGSVLVVVLLLEAGLRIAGTEPKTATVLTRYFEFDPELGWHGIPGASHQFTTVDFDVRASNDADGFRTGLLDFRIDRDAAFEGTMVWILGDSTTWGWGVEDGQTFTDHLNRMSGPDLRFRNLGVTGYAAVQEWLMLREYFRRGLRPDLVLILFSTNDLNEIVDNSGLRPRFTVHGDTAELTNHPVPRGSKWRFSAWLKRHSRLYNHLHFYLTSIKLRLRADTREEKYRQGRLTRVQASPEQRVALREALTRIRDLCREHGVRFAVMTEAPDGIAVLSGICPALEIPVLDLSGPWGKRLESADAPPIYFRSDPHANTEGHRLLAETAHPKIVELLR